MSFFVPTVFYFTANLGFLQPKTKQTAENGLKNVFVWFLIPGIMVIAFKKVICYNGEKSVKCKQRPENSRGFKPCFGFKNVFRQVRIKLFAFYSAAFASEREFGRMKNKSVCLSSVKTVCALVN